jgi:hypothetical protein
MKRSQEILIISIVGIFLFLGAIGTLWWLIYNKPPFVPHTVEFTFIRELKDGGNKINPASLSGVRGEKVAEVFSPENKAAYGAHTATVQGGLGLRVTLRTTFKGKDVGEPKVLNLIPTLTAEPPSNPARVALVSRAEAEFENALSSFTGEQRVNRATAFFLDTTSGVPRALAARVAGVVRAEARTCAVGLNIFNFYNLYAEDYQGGREQVDFCDAQAVTGATERFVAPNAGAKKSSLLGAIKSGLMELSDSVRNMSPIIVRAHFFTDGLQNDDQLSVYKDRTLLEPRNWSKLDAVFDLEGLTLEGFEIHLHKLPANTTDRPQVLMDRALAYLADRLKKKGAEVTVEQF